MGRTAMMQGDFGNAATWLQKSAALFAELGGCRGTAGSLECIAHFAALTSRQWSAARLLGAAAALREVTGERLPPSEQAGREETALAVQAALGEQAYALACEEGRALRPESALAEALTLLR
jgi:hypothetical protein